MATIGERDLPAKARAVFLARLRSGESAEAAAEAAGVAAQSLEQTAQRDGELRAALDGMPAAVQVAAQRAEFLSALVCCGGDQPRAEARAGLPVGAVSAWRRAEPEFDAAVVAILAWLDAVNARPRKRQTHLTQADRERLRDMWQSGVSTTRIAEEFAVAKNTVANWADRMGLPSRNVPEDRLPELGDRFRELWESGASYATIRAELGIGTGTVVRWRKELKLSGRRGEKNS